MLFLKCTRTYLVDTFTINLHNLRARGPGVECRTLDSDVMGSNQVPDCFQNFTLLPTTAEYWLNTWEHLGALSSH